MTGLTTICSIVEHDDYPKTLAELEQRFSTEEACREYLFQLCHREAALIKQWLTGTHQGAVSHEHLGYYLDEYTFRFNRRTSWYRGKLFYRLLQNAVAVNAIPYQEIAKGIRRQKSQNTISSG